MYILSHPDSFSKLALCLYFVFKNIFSFSAILELPIKNLKCYLLLIFSYQNRTAVPISCSIFVLTWDPYRHSPLKIQTGGYTVDQKP